MLKLRLPRVLLVTTFATAGLALALPQEAARDVPQETPQETRGEAEAPPAREHVQGELPWEWSEQLTWRSIGPANMGGRITSIAGHPDDPCVYWIGTAGGGVLKTVNNGVSYQHQFTDQGSASIGALAVAPSNPDVVWVGTGENNPRNSVSWGDGVYKSTDGGATWRHMGLAASFQVSTILVHPGDENVVYVAALGRLWGPNEERGLFKTTDGGESWEKVLYVDDRTGVIDARMKPDDPETLVVATYERERDLYCTNDPAKKWGPGAGVYRTTDGGKSFQKITAGLPTCELGRIGLDWYEKDPNVVFAVVESARITQEPENAAHFGVRGEDAENFGVRLRTVDEDGPAAEAGLREGDVLIRVGEKTILTNEELDREVRQYVAGDEIEVEVVRERKAHAIKVTFGPRPEPDEDEETTDEHGRPRPGPFHGGLGGQRENVQDLQGDEGHEYGGVYRSDDAGVTWTRINSCNPRPMYYSEIRVDPSDDSYVYVLGTSLYRSKDGGATFTPDGHGREVHVDHHAMWVDPRDGRHIILGNDGGIYVTWDRMETWDHHNHVAIGQFYNVAVDPTPDYKVYGGLQDNGSWGGPNRVAHGSGPSNSDWYRVGGGDGFVTRVDENDPDLVYYESQNGGMGRTNLRTGEGGFIRPRGGQGERYRFNWNTPFVLSSHNSRIHYSAGNYVFRSLDRGNSARRISPEVTATERGSASALAESFTDSDVLWVGTDDGGFWMTKDGGSTWTDLWTLNEGLEKRPVAKAVAKARAVAYRPEAPEAQDAVSGSWRCKAEGEGIEGEDDGRFELELSLGEGGEVTGRIASEIGEGPITKGSFQDGTLRFTFATESLTLEFEGRVGEDAVEGSINAAGGAFAFTFRGQRTGTPEAQTEVEAREAVAVQDVEEGAAEEEPAQDEPQEEPKKRKFLEDTIDQLLPGRRYVSSIVPSRHRQNRVYVTFDGHRSDDDDPYVFVSNDLGETWESLRSNLPTSAGSVRDLDEDITNRDVLYLGTEFGAFVSVDAGESWTELGGNLPTVAVHDFAQHPTSGELIAGTHGRSVWVLDVTPLRQMSKDAIQADATLYAPNRVIRWRGRPGRGSTTREFVGQNPPDGARIFYSLDSREREVALEVRDLQGEVLRELEASGEKGLHRVYWDLRRGRTDEDDAGGGGRRGGGRFRRGRTVDAGTYVVALRVGDEEYTQQLEVVNDPTQSDDRWTEYEELNELMQEGGVLEAMEALGLLEEGARGEDEGRDR